MSFLVWLYRSVARILQPLAYIVLPLGALLFPKWRQGWKERLGFVPQLEGGDKKVIWVHAASVGEVETIWPLVKMLSRKFDVVVSTLTPTGQNTARSKTEAKACFLFPLDMPKFVARSIKRIKPDLVITVETEFWPCFIYEIRRQNIPFALVNARISDRTLSRYLLLRPLFAPLLNSASLISTQSDEHAKRFASMGIDDGKIISPGNLKLDIDPKALEERAAMLEAELGPFTPRDKPIIVFASTHKGEEELLLPVISSIRNRALCIIVPRHPERAGDVAKTILAEGLEFSLLSSGMPHPDVLIVDAIGKLVFFYAKSTLAFVGGSLVPIGGHNIAEPAALGKPVLFGPHMFNFRDAAKILIEEGGATMVRNAAELALATKELLDDPSKANEIGSRARNAIEKHRGAIERTYRAVCELLEGSAASEAP